MARTTAKARDHALSLLVTAEAAVALERLARSTSATRAEVFEAMVVRADAARQARLDPGSAKWVAYFRVTR
jgi:hypothetical protein